MDDHEAYSTRRPEDQPLVARVADHFLETKERNLIQRLLGKAPQFTQDEYRLLKSRLPSWQVGSGGVGGREPALSFISLYKYMSTIDQVLNHLRQLDWQTENIDSLVSEDNQKSLDREILAPDFRLWGWVDYQAAVIPTKERYTQGSVLSSKYTVNGAGQPLEKNVGHLCFDEAVLCSFPIINELIALAQGLYYSTSGNWINAQHGVIANDNLVGLASGNLEDVKEMTSNYYVANKSEIAVHALGRELAARLFGTGSGGGEEETEEYEVTTGEGKTETKTRTVRKEGKGLSIAGVTGGAIPHYITDNAGAGVNGRTWDAIKQLYKSGKETKYMFCERLSEAVTDSGVLSDMQNMFYELQKKYLLRRSTTTLGYRTQNPLNMLAHRNRADGYATTFGCGPGMRTKFLDYDGLEVEPKRAIITRNGKQYVNTGLVDPDRSYCTAAIPLSGMSGGYAPMSAMMINGGQISRPFPDAYNDIGISSSAPWPPASSSRPAPPPLQPSMTPAAASTAATTAMATAAATAASAPVSMASASAAPMQSYMGHKKKKKGGKKSGD